MPKNEGFIHNRGIIDFHVGSDPDHLVDLIDQHMGKTQAKPALGLAQTSQNQYTSAGVLKPCLHHVAWHYSHHHPNIIQPVIEGSVMAKIKVKTPIVEMDGDEMTDHLAENQR